jgi:signal-transduction protein with cAMP-binding, CBS, and nucleotidyltransferase domain
MRHKTPEITDSIRTLMSSTPNSVASNDSLRTAAKHLWMNGVGAVLVGDPVQPEGILSERDVVAALAEGLDADSTTARQLMTTPVVMVDADDPVFEVALQMLDQAFRHMPVTEEHQGVVGVVSLRDLVRPLLLDALTPPPTGSG